MSSQLLKVWATCRLKVWAAKVRLLKLLLLSPLVARRRRGRVPRLKQIGFPCWRSNFHRHCARQHEGRSEEEEGGGREKKGRVRRRREKRLARGREMWRGEVRREERRGRGGEVRGREGEVR
eukprot:749234-Hanusia_phi.AAC.2